MIVLYGIDLITDIYLGIGAGAAESSKFFTMGYIILITLLIYRIANTIAIIKVQSIHKKAEQYRSEVINLAFKGINFFIFLVGFLIILNVYGFNLIVVNKLLPVLVPFARTKFKGKGFCQGKVAAIDGDKIAVVQITQCRRHTTP